MRFSALVVSGAFAMAAAQSATVSLTAAQESQAACLKTCKGGDVNCQAHCVGVPNPNDSQVNANTKCASECPQGDGSPDQTQKFADCLAKCRGEHYFTSGGTPQATGGSDSASGASKAADVTISAGAASSVVASVSSEVTSLVASISSAVGSATSAAGSAATTAAASGSGSGSGSGSSATTSTSKGLAPVATAAPVAIVGLVAAVLAL